MAETAATIIVAIFASTGFWTLLQTIYTNHANKKRANKTDVSDILKRIDEQDAKINKISEAVMGTKHKELMEICQMYIDRGYILPEEYTDLREYIYDPYRKLNGNGTGEMMMKKVDSLPNSKPKEV